MLGNVLHKCKISKHIQPGLCFGATPLQKSHILTLYNPVLACFVGAVAAAPTKHARTGTFVRTLGDFGI
jgi:hypothetical protein